MSFIKVLGIGSPFGEDRVGWEAADALKKIVSIQSDISPCRLKKPSIMLLLK